MRELLKTKQYDANKKNKIEFNKERELVTRVLSTHIKL